MKADVKFDLRPIQRALKKLAPQVKQSRRELVEQAARGFVKEVVEITPPGGSGRRGNAAKKVGEAAIKFDLSRVMAAALSPVVLSLRPRAPSPAVLSLRPPALSQAVLRLRPPALSPAARSLRASGRPPQGRAGWSVRFG